MDRAALDAALIAAHEEGDHARLVALYAEAANGAEAARDTGAACIFLIHAYIPLGGPPTERTCMEHRRRGTRQSPHTVRPRRLHRQGRSGTEQQSLGQGRDRLRAG